ADDHRVPGRLSRVARRRLRPPGRPPGRAGRRRAQPGARRVGGRGGHRGELSLRLVGRRRLQRGAAGRSSGRPRRDRHDRRDRPPRLTGAGVASGPAMTSPLPRVVVVGLGPGGPDLVTAGVTAAIDRSAVRFLRTTRHPSVPVVGRATSFDELYERADSIEDVYGGIVESLVAAAAAHGEVLYAVPGSDRKSVV